MTGVRRAIILSTAERYVALVGNFLTLALVSRILTPGELGVSVVGLALVGMLATIREFAGSDLLIQHRDLSPELARTGFTVIFAGTAVVSVGLIAFASPAAGIFGDDRLVPFLQVTAVALMLETFGQFPCTLLRREMRFGTLAVVNLIATFTTATVVVGLALLGFSYMSFAWAWLITAVMVTVVANAVWRDPSVFLPNIRGWRSLVTFGGYNGGTVLAYQLFEAAPYLVLGRILSLDAAAFYHRAVLISRVPDKVFLAGAASVVFPAFSVEVRQGRSLKRSYLRALELITVLQWPALLVLSALAYPVVDALLGSQWDEVAPLVQIVALAWLFSFSFQLNFPVLAAVGAIRDVFLRAVIVFPVSTAIIAGAAVFGLKAAACGMLVAVPFHAFVGLTFVRRRLDLSWGDLAGAVRSSAIVSLATVAGPLILALTARPVFELSVPLAVVAAAVAVVSWFSALRLVRHPMLDEIAHAVPHRLRISLHRRQRAMPVGE